MDFDDLIEYELLLRRRGGMTVCAIAAVGVAWSLF